MIRPANIILMFLWLCLLSACSPLAGTGTDFVSDGVRIRYYDIGEGEPLFLLHGFAMRAELQWGGMVEELSQHYRLIIPDHRGHGDSEKLVGRENYGRKMVDDVIHLMDHLEIDEARIVGMSMGGFMTVAAANLYPERVRCGFVGAAGWVDPDQRESEIDEEIAIAFEQGVGFERLAVLLNPHAENEDEGGWLGRFFFDLMVGGQDPMVLASIYRGMSDFSLSRDVMTNGKVPLLTIIGDRDGLLPLAQALEDLSDNYELLVLPGHDHGTVGNAEEFSASMLDFFSDQVRCGARAQVTWNP